MALRGHVFTKQLFSSDCFALFIDTFLGKNSGIVQGCEMTATESAIIINNGYFCVKGRFLEEEGSSILSIEPSTNQEMFCKLVCEIDLSKENTTSILNQAYYKILESEEDYPASQQDDITNEAGIYQFEFARFKRTEQGISDFRDTRVWIDFDSIYMEVRRNMKYVLDDISINAEKEFNEWFNTVKGVLDGDVAGNLLNLIMEKADKKRIYKLTIDTEWNEDTTVYTKTIAIERITENDIVKIYPVWSDDLKTRLLEKEEYDKISVVHSKNGSIELICDEEKPNMNLNVRLEAM